MTAKAPLSERMAFSVREAGEMVGVSKDAIYALIRTGDLPSLKIGQRTFIRREALAHFLEQREAT